RQRARTHHRKIDVDRGARYRRERVVIQRQTVAEIPRRSGHPLPISSSFAPELARPEALSTRPATQTLPAGGTRAASSATELQRRKYETTQLRHTAFVRGAISSARRSGVRTARGASTCGCARPGAVVPARSTLPSGS